MEDGGRMLSLERLRQTALEYVGLGANTSKWTVGDSPLGGRGIIATEDIASGEVIFVDRPLVYGPRAGTVLQGGCTACYRTREPSFFKCHKCALLLCSEGCQNTTTHKNDCSVISRWTSKVALEDVDDTLLSRTLTTIRALLLSVQEKRFLGSLQAHTSSRHGSEVRDLRQYFEIPEDEEEFMVLACCTLDTNAFQISGSYGKEKVSLRGLYPVGGLMNHSCISNTKHSFDSQYRMSIKAVKPIAAGTEVFTCYTGLLWGTPARRRHLYKTKHFLCACNRCSDPTESGTLLAALKCFSLECMGTIIPINPLNMSTPWKCLDCGMRVPDKNICAVQGALGSLMGTLNFENVTQLEEFLQHRIAKFIPKTNQIVVDLQCRLIWLLGETDGLRWHELSEERLLLKESLCRGVLRTVAALCAGDTHLRGLLLYHLHAALAERARRHPDLYEELKSEIESTIEQAYFILEDDISSPPDLELRLQYLGPGCDKPPQERFFILHSN